MATYTPYTPNYNRMQAAVSAAQQQRATVAGPPSPMMTSGVDVSAQMPTQLNGVEMQAAAKRPAPAMINTVASDRVAQLGMMSPTTPTSAPQAVSSPGMIPTPQAPAASPLGGMAAASPLGGMSAAPLSSRGGPMSYSQQGVGTTNPNSFAVGRNNKDFAARTNPMMVSSAPNMMTARSAPMAMLSGPSSPRVAGPSMMPPPPPAGAPAGRDDAFWAGLKQQSADYQTQVQTERAATAESDAKAQADKLAREQMMQVTTTQIPGTDYVIPFAGSKAMGTVPIQKPDAPMTADDVAAARAMGGDVTIQQGDTQVRFPSMAKPNPTRLTPIPGAPSMIQGGTATPDRVFDPYTGNYYEAGKVPGRGTAQAPAAAAPPAAAGSAAAPAKKSRFMDLINQR